MLLLEKVRSYPMIGQLGDDELTAVLPLLSVNEFTDNQMILKQGQVSARLHILLSGEVNVYLEHFMDISVATLREGQFFGEMSCLTGEAVSATIKAIGHVRTISLPREGVMKLMDSCPLFRQQMVHALIKRVSQSNRRIEEENIKSYVAMQQLSEERYSKYGRLIGSSEFMQHLQQQIDRLAMQDHMVSIIGEHGVGKYHTAYEIHQRSHRKHYPLITVDASKDLDASEWERQVHMANGGTVILRHADQLPVDLLQQLISVAGGARLIITAKEITSQITSQIRMQIVHLIPLRERAEDIPELVYEFLNKAGVTEPEEHISFEALQMLMSYPFVSDNIEGLQRVVTKAVMFSDGRKIRIEHLKFTSTRKPGERAKIGVALGSGSVRGAAHVGVLKALEEAGIPVDLIAGTSVGAFIGALYVGGQPISAFERVLPTVRWRQLVNLTLPTRAFVENSPMSRFVEKYIGTVDFEDLPIPFAAVAADAQTGESYILNKGRVSHAICASTAIPGIMKPVQYQGRMLIDGGVVHPVPVALARSMGADIVIAVNTSIAPQKSLPKSFISHILNTMEIMSSKIIREELQLADVVITPHVENSVTTFKRSSELIVEGTHVTQQLMPVIRSRIVACATVNQ